MDGIDRMVKRVVSREVMSGRASVDSSQGFATVGADTCKETKILHIGKEEIEATKLKLEEQFVVSTHSIDPCLWGESDHPAFGPPVSISLHLASNSITPAGSVHKSRGDSVVHMWVQLKRWCGCCRGGIVVMDAICRRLCVCMI